MIRERDPFGRALETLRGRLRNGEFGQGQALSIVDLARELNLSATPVREALARLAGEGLVEDRRGRGYFNWRLDVIDLVELYDLHGLYVAGALQLLAGQSSEHRQTLAGELEPVDSGPAVFGGLMRLAGSRALMLSHATLADRLEPVGRIEAQVLPDLGAETAKLGDYLRAADWPAFSAAAETYHRRRRAAATDIVVALRRQDCRAGI